MATYAAIRKWIQQEYKFQVKTCWIAHCKELAGLPVASIYDPKKGRQQKCPEAKKETIFAAFRHFGMIQ